MILRISLVLLMTYLQAGFVLDHAVDQSDQSKSNVQADGQQGNERGGQGEGGQRGGEGGRGDEKEDPQRSQRPILIRDTRRHPNQAL